MNGFVTQIIGPVIDVEFPEGELPKIYKKNNYKIFQCMSANTCQILFEWSLTAIKNREDITEMIKPQW